MAKYKKDMSNKFKACGVATLRSVRVVLICAVILGCGDGPGATTHVAPPSHDKQMLAQPQSLGATQNSRGEWGIWVISASGTWQSTS